MTLADAGSLVNRTRERMRQIEVIWKNACAAKTLTELDRAFIKAVGEAMPNSEDELYDFLISSGWLRAPWGIDGIKTVYGFCNKKLGWSRLDSAGDATVWVNESADVELPPYGKVDSIIREAADGDDVLRLKDAIEAVRNLSVPGRVLRESTALFLIERTKSLTISAPYVIRSPESTSRSRFHNSSQLTLSVCGALPPQSLWKGLERRYAARGARPVSLDAAMSIWRNHPDYRADDDLVALTESASPRQPSSAEVVALELLRDRGCVSRTEFVEYLTQHGVPIATATTTLSFSSIIEPSPDQRGWWRLRGSDHRPSRPSPRPASSTAKVDAQTGVGGRVDATFDLGPTATGLIYLPAKDGRELRGRSFQAVLRTPDGERELPGFYIKVNKSGASWGYRPILAVAKATSAADANTSLCRASFNPRESVVAISFA